MRNPPVEIAVIGAGPRGVSVLERICANAHRSVLDTPAVVHIIDPHPPGAGEVWRTAQSGRLLMNTVASQVTLFTDGSVDLAGPIVPGPSLYEWARHVTLFGGVDGYDARLLPVAAEIGPDTYPPRAFYGQYLEWVFRRILRTAPEHVTVRVHRSRAVGLRNSLGPDFKDGPQTVVLENGTCLEDLDAVVLAQGHLPVEPADQESALADYAAANSLVYVPPANPADSALTAIGPGQPVLLRGLGLNYFDYQTLLTAGRGGSFEQRDGRLVYIRSGREPQLYAGSRRGIPYHSRGDNQKGAHGRHEPVVLTPDVIERLARRARSSGVDFRRDLWPLIAKEVEGVYYTALVAGRACTCDADRFRARFLLCARHSPQEDRLLDEFGIAPADRWDWERLARPFSDREFTGPDDFRGWLVDYLRADLDAARAGNVNGPLKAALDVLRDLRNEIRLIVDYGGLTGTSHREDLDLWYTPLNAFLSIGPPARRVEEMVALIEAGVLELIGPEMTVRTGPEVAGFEAGSAAVPDSFVTATALIEARLPTTDLRRTADPLLRELTATGGCRTYWIDSPDGEGYETGGLAVTTSPHYLIEADDRPHPRRFAFGVPTESVHWVTAAGIRPGVNSVTLADSDAIARALLGAAQPLRSDTTVTVSMPSDTISMPAEAAPPTTSGDAMSAGAH
ncbi:MAG TPA: FAD/NAD(P)-binding protein [Actinocrinis sp.]|nr:FAD/NAD(P)-binding protein [Actinocrinis sp.]